MLNETKPIPYFVIYLTTQVVPQKTASVVGICERCNGKNLEGDDRVLIDTGYYLGILKEIQN